MRFPTTPVLNGQHVQLVPLLPEHAAPLAEAVRDGEAWKLWYTSVPSPDSMAEVIAERLRLAETGSFAPYTVLDRQGRAIGMTNYLNIDAESKRLEIGFTWYRASVQRGPTNTESKLLLLTHAFESLDCIAVEFRTHRLNVQSRRAIERLGAQLDGILRAHRRSADGSLRDTAVYSITATEWPAVKIHLKWQLQKPR